MYKKCERKALHFRNEGLDDEAVVHILMQDEPWQQQRFRELEKLLEDADKFLTVR
jgi:hypothetical protein